MRLAASLFIEARNTVLVAAGELSLPHELVDVGDLEGWSASLVTTDVSASACSRGGWKQWTSKVSRSEFSATHWSSAVAGLRRCDCK